MATLPNRTTALIDAPARLHARFTSLKPTLLNPTPDLVIEQWKEGLKDTRSDVEIYDAFLEAKANAKRAQKRKAEGEPEIDAPDAPPYPGSVESFIQVFEKMDDAEFANFQRHSGNGHPNLHTAMRVVHAYRFDAIEAVPRFVKRCVTTTDAESELCGPNGETHETHELTLVPTETGQGKGAKKAIATWVKKQASA